MSPVTIKGTWNRVIMRSCQVITGVGIVTVQPEIIAVGEGISNTETAVNVTVDLVDGKPLDKIAAERVPSVVLGQLGKKATKAMKKAGAPNQTKNKVIFRTQ